ncbi:MAG: COX15/CtaA family protein [Alphaproteobacteria bacterium]|nr:COX15/CtaA family protein [Alphaproteobacteria bacterium]
MMQNKQVGVWLLILLFATLAMVAIGAITRLTDSGLSMVEWRPLMGALPPLSQKEWLRIFALYQQIPEYQQSVGIDLSSFKQIFFWEYMHRLWGRLLGFLFLLPWLYFWWQGVIGRKKAFALLLIPLLGGVQAVIGWWMVKSGFVDRVDVSQYRLLVHLTVAVMIVMLIWQHYLRHAGLVTGKLRLVMNPALLMMLLLILTIIAGAFVAGTRAGLIYNQFPLMGQRLIPSDYVPYQGTSLVTILFENPASIQLHHRILAMMSFICGVIFALKCRPAYYQAFLGLLAVQFMLGIITLLTALFVPMAVLHQLGAIALLMLIWLIYQKSNEQTCEED